MCRPALLLALLVWPLAASAQYPLFGELTSSDDTLDDGEHFDIHTIYVTEGVPHHFVLVSPDFDPYLLVTLEGKAETVASNDDCSLGDRARSCLRYVPKHTGRVDVYVTSYASGETGHYRLAHKSRAQPDPSRPVVAASGGRLTADSDAFSTGEHYIEIKTGLLKGDRLSLRMVSIELDPFLVLIAPDGAESANDACTPDAREACFDFTADQSGDWKIRCTTSAAGELGHFVLGVGVNASFDDLAYVDEMLTRSAGAAQGVVFGQEE